MSQSDEYRFVNLTSRELRFVRDDKSDILIPLSGSVVSTQRNVRSIYEVQGIQVAEATYAIPSVPEPQDNVGYIVTWRTLMTLKAQGFDVNDIYCPDGLVKDDSSGRIVGASSLLRLPAYS